MKSATRAAADLGLHVIDQYAAALNRALDLADIDDDIDKRTIEAAAVAGVMRIAGERIGLPEGWPLAAKLQVVAMIVGCYLDREGHQRLVSDPSLHDAISRFTKAKTRVKEF